MIRIFLLSFIFLLVIYSNDYAADSIPTRIYTRFEVTAYSEQKFDSQRVEKIAKGVVLQVITTDSEWYKVRTPSGAEGWLAKKWVVENENELIAEEQNKQQQINKEIAEIEEQIKNIPPSETYKIINSYRKLVELAPGKQTYREKLDFFEKEAKKMVNFRQVKWGMGIDDVAKTETSKPTLKNDHLLVYPSTIDGKDVEVVYIFAQGVLVRAKYVLKEKHTNNNDYITDYMSLKSLLTKKYGKPSPDSDYWKDDLYKNDSSREGLAISMGHRVYLAQWKTEPTDIAIILSGDNFHITCAIEYSSKDLKHRENKEKEKQTLDKL